ncbi:MAG: DNA methyltransferase [Betaproteobacteria bacterium]
MPKITLINADCATIDATADIIMTDPPYEMDGKKLAEIIDHFDCKHLVMLTTMKQLLEFSRHSAYVLNFDFVINAVVPKKSKSLLQPNYTHQTGVYMTKGRVKSKFNRKRRMRSDVSDANGYWSTVFRAPRDRMDEHGMAKNLQAITDILGSFDVETVLDPFAGSGTTGFAAYDVGCDCTLIEQDEGYFAAARRSFAAVGIHV